MLVLTLQLTHPIPSFASAAEFKLHVDRGCDKILRLSRDIKLSHRIPKKSFPGFIVLARQCKDNKRNGLQTSQRDKVTTGTIRMASESNRNRQNSFPGFIVLARQCKCDDGTASRPVRGIK